jgi:hypothetical protein
MSLIFPPLGRETLCTGRRVYTFIILADDGVRLWPGGKLLFDEWHHQSSADYAKSIAEKGLLL